MSRWLSRSALAALTMAGLSACGSSGGGPDNDNGGGGMQMSRLEDRFGTDFGTAFRASANSEPIDPADGAIIPVSLTAEPTEVN